MFERKLWSEEVINEQFRKIDCSENLCWTKKGWRMQEMTTDGWNGERLPKKSTKHQKIKEQENNVDSGKYYFI